MPPANYSRMTIVADQLHSTTELGCDSACNSLKASKRSTRYNRFEHTVRSHATRGRMHKISLGGLPEWMCSKKEQAALNHAKLKDMLWWYGNEDEEHLKRIFDTYREELGLGRMVCFPIRISLPFLLSSSHLFSRFVSCQEFVGQIRRQVAKEQRDPACLITVDEVAVYNRLPIITGFSRCIATPPGQRCPLIHTVVSINVFASFCFLLSLCFVWRKVVLLLILALFLSCFSAEFPDLLQHSRRFD